MPHLPDLRTSGPQTLDYLTHLRRESDRFLECLQGAEPTAPVPSCPGWTASDLLWHLAEVQTFWSGVVSHRLDGPEPAEAAKPLRPTDYAALHAVAGAAADTLHS